ncbi:MAG TPA: HEAT repeat domain-containing protein, partial [Elusimicrobiales bacterium]|nr:HEAT repeat domain-containing protein [Elusimicrobiales bacterium]
MKITTILLTGFFALTRPAAAQDEAGKDLVQLRAGRTSGERAAAAMRLGSVRNIDAVRPLVEALEDEKSVVQRQAMAALGEICSASGAKSGDCAGLAVPALQRKAVSADNEIKSRALKTLAKLGVKPASTAGALAADPPASLRKSPPDYLIKTLAELKPADIAHSTVPKAYICPPELKVALDKDHTCHTHIIDDSPDWSLPMPPDGCTLGKWGLGSLQLTGMEVYGSPNGDKTAPMEHLLCHYFSPDKKYTPPAKVRTAPEGLTCKVTSTDTFSCMPLAKFHCPAELTLL